MCEWLLVIFSYARPYIDLVPEIAPRAKKTKTMAFTRNRHDSTFKWSIIQKGEEEEGGAAAAVAHLSWEEARKGGNGGQSDGGG